MSTNLPVDPLQRYSTAIPAPKTSLHADVQQYYEIAGPKERWHNVYAPLLGMLMGTGNILDIISSPGKNNARTVVNL